jgi:hypothetical protein
VNRRVLVSVTVFGAISCALYGVSLVTRAIRQTSLCQANLKQIGLALKIYERDYDEKTVLASNWETALWVYRGVGKPKVPRDEVFDCPSNYNYAFNRHTSGANHTQIVDYVGTPTVFDSNSAKAVPRILALLFH